jgi:hypothetical protein
VRSEHLFGFVKDNAEEFKLDLALVCDTSMWDEKTPAITTSLRGLVYEEVRVTCADRDLHSGIFGGAAQNPLRVLCKTRTDASPSRILNGGRAREIMDLKLKLRPNNFWAASASKCGGEKNRMLIEQISTRPTVINASSAVTLAKALRPIPGRQCKGLPRREAKPQGGDAFRVRGARLPGCQGRISNFGLAPRSSFRSTIRRWSRRARR